MFWDGSSIDSLAAISSNVGGYLTLHGIVLTTVFETKLYNRSDSLLFFSVERASVRRCPLVDFSQGRLQLRVARENVFSDRLLNDEFQDLHCCRTSDRVTFYHFLILFTTFLHFWRRDRALRQLPHSSALEGDVERRASLCADVVHRNARMQFNENEAAALFHLEHA